MGCDLSVSICKQVEKVYRISMHCGSLETLEGIHHYSIIVINYVLEHVHRPIEFTEKICRLLAPGGKVHIAMPIVS